MKRNLVGKILGKIKIFVQDFVPIRTALIDEIICLNYVKKCVERKIISVFLKNVSAPCLVLVSRSPRPVATKRPPTMILVMPLLRAALPHRSKRHRGHHTVGEEEWLEFVTVHNF